MTTHAKPTAAPSTTFSLPRDREAVAPPERRGVDRDGVRLMVVSDDHLAHRMFRELPDVLDPGDLVVINTSATVPAALDAVRSDGSPVTVHVSSELDDGAWVIELRRPAGDGPYWDAVPGERIVVTGGAALTLVSPYPDVTQTTSRLWTASSTHLGNAIDYLTEHGRPISYAHHREPIALDDVQNVYARQPGSAEMASAGRPLTAQVITNLVARGVTVAPIVLHAGVSSPDGHEPPTPERFTVPPTTARLANAARAAGGRVIAIGTTVVRTLESAVGHGGLVRPRSGWTNHLVTPENPPRVVNGIVTGLHLPEASHLLMLEAIAGAVAIQHAYDEAVRCGYLWHEFGDSMLLLPRRTVAPGTVLPLRAAPQNALAA